MAAAAREESERKESSTMGRWTGLGLCPASEVGTSEITRRVALQVDGTLFGQLIPVEKACPLTNGQCMNDGILRRDKTSLLMMIPEPLVQVSANGNEMEWKGKGKGECDKIGTFYSDLISRGQTTPRRRGDRKCPVEPSLLLPPLKLREMTDIPCQL